jgi:outer membrane protein OmpA-like peptidoglycan-associated protein
MATDRVIDKVKVFEEKEKKGLATWMWLLPLLLLLAIGIWFLSRRHDATTTAATPVTDQTKPDSGVGTQAAAGALTAASIADSIRSKGRVSFGDNDVHFATGSATLAGDSQAVLDQTAQALQSNRDWRIRVVGHTDSVGTSSANEQLAQQRASSVMGYLTAHGVDQSRLSVDAKGDSEPVSSNNSDAGRAQNRRVDLIKQ